MPKSKGVVSEVLEGAASAAPVSVPIPKRRVRITLGGAVNTHEFKGRTFSRDGVLTSIEELGWTTDDERAAASDPHLVIEPI